MEKKKRTSTINSKARAPLNHRDTLGRNPPKHRDTMGDSSDIKGSGLSTLKKPEEAAGHSLNYKKIVSLTKKF